MNSKYVNTSTEFHYNYPNMDCMFQKLTKRTIVHLKCLTKCLVRLLGIFLSDNKLAVTFFSNLTSNPSNPKSKLNTEREFSWVGVNCSKFDCSTINWSTLLAGNQLLHTKFFNCLNRVNPRSTRFDRLTKKVTTGWHCWALTLFSSATHKLKKSIFNP